MWRSRTGRLRYSLGELTDDVEDPVTEGGGRDQHAEGQGEKDGQPLVGPASGLHLPAYAHVAVNFARAQGTAVIVKGLRAVSDYEAEIQMAQMNHRLGGVETMFMPTNPKWSFLSSSLVKEVARFGGEVDGLVPDHVRKRLVDRIEGR